MNYETKEEILDQVVALIHKKSPPKQAELITEFARQYYAMVAFEDLQLRSPDEWYAIVLSHWNFAAQRKPGECKIRVYNPEYTEHYSVIEIVDSDKPFLVDSTRMAIIQKNLGIHFIIHFGEIHFSRDNSDHITHIFPKGVSSLPENSTSEAFIHIEIDRQTTPEILEKLKILLEQTLADVHLAVEDWQKMREKVEDAIHTLEQTPPPLDPTEIEEAKCFLSWLLDNHFTFMGYREYQVTPDALVTVKNTGLGVLRNERSHHAIRHFSDLPLEARKLAFSPQILVISKTNTLSNVHRPTYTDYVGIKRFDKNGEVIGEDRFIGLYTSTAYNSDPTTIPLLRHKVDTVMERSGLPPKGHAGKELLNILTTLPRDDLFQASREELYDLAMSILALQERHIIRLFIRKDIYSRFCSCMVYLPRERVTPALTHAMEAILMKELHGTESEVSTQFTESILARIHFLIRTKPQGELEYDRKAIETKLIEAARSWRDGVHSLLIDHYGESKGNALNYQYGESFPPGYRDDFEPQDAIHDIEYMERLSPQNPLEMNFYRSLTNENGSIRLRLYQADKAIPLSDVLPMLENMGLRVLGEQPYELNLKDGKIIWINDLGMVCNQADSLDVQALRDIFQSAFLHIWQGEAENDAFNRLVIEAQCDWREVMILRAYAKYLRQLGFTFSQAYIETTLAKNPSIAKHLIDLFKLRFDPADNPEREMQTAALEKQLHVAFDAVANLDEDRILRRFYSLIKATFRTNYFQLNEQGQPKPYLSYKFDSAQIPEMPLPYPKFEIFVYSPRFEGVHLRGSEVARGGIRWSDRREDFRTEILGLMKAQQVKNAVIVPSGAKGGFVPKNLPTGDRDAIMAEGIACYQNFIRGLLDLTDNLRGDEIISPANTVRYDKDDMYLVVAADKGTAAFSDIANAISQEYGFWLGDAFASGGSAGYDHKKMGITARGAWESVKRHFCELGINPSSMDFTVIGIGDMSGDVFGNGLLMSTHIRLVAAFNHQHIFLDPNPDALKSYQERERLFNLPRSSWEDYNPALISQGGGVYLRSAKAIPLSSEIKQLLNLEGETIVPNDLIRAILKAQVDLLWNGGIGTYVKATQERNLEVGDRANDAIRINGNELRCQVVGEGGNLGFTQLGRVEYALNGGLIYTDFIDNSGGVDCSDHEVNIKILFNDLLLNGDMTLKQRNTLLAEMTEEVGQLVLQDNYYQTRAISYAAAQVTANLDLYSRYMNTEEQAGYLPRALEFLPDQKTLMERKVIGQGLTRPELAILLAYCKIKLKGEILASKLPEDPYLSQAIELEFPVRLHKPFRTQMEQHSLRREIVATQLSNRMINHMGITFMHRLQDETGAPISAIVKAYAVAEKVFEMESLMALVESLDYKVSVDIQTKMMTRITRLIRRTTRWFLRNRRAQLDIMNTIEHFRVGVSQLYDHLPKLLTGLPLEKFIALTHEFTEAGVPEDIARKIAITREMFSVLDIVECATEYQLDLDKVATVYFALDERLDLGWLRDQFSNHPVNDHWDALARAGLRDDLDWQQRGLTVGVIKTKTGQETVDGHIDAWMEQHHPLVQRWQLMLAELRSSASLEFLMFSVAIRELLDLTQTSLQAVK